MPGIARVIHSQVGRDPIKPSGKPRLGPVTFPGAIDAQKYFLCQFFGNSLVPHHPEQEVNHRPMVFFDKVIKTRLVAGRNPQHHGGVAGRVSFSPQCCRRIDSQLPGRSLSRSQHRAVQHHGSHIFWNPVFAGRLRFRFRFRIGFRVGFRVRLPAAGTPRTPIRCLRSGNCGESCRRGRIGTFGMRTQARGAGRCEAKRRLPGAGKQHGAEE